MKKEKMTIGICARNAAGTVERAIASVLPEKDCDILFIDDHCTDDTVARAKALAGNRIKILKVPDPGNVAMARQVALDAMDTEFGAWLDADDEWIPGRAARLTAALKTGFDVAMEPMELFDGPTGKLLRRMDIPSFITREPTPGRLFERNHLPSDATVGFRVECFRKAGGYDGVIGTAENYDILLRAMAHGARFHYGSDVVGYRVYAYPGSLSRQLDKQRAATAAVLRKHSYDDVRRICSKAGYQPRVAAWVLVSMAMFRKEWDAALGFLEEASPANAEPEITLEPDGPWPLKEGWRRAFQRGTILLLQSGRDAEAAGELQKAQAVESTAEGANNLGVALSRLGKKTEALPCFELAEKLFPGYLDPKLNKQGAAPLRITTHPLRRQANRSEYAQPAHKQ